MSEVTIEDGLLSNAVDEIERLRRQNEIMEARLRMFDEVMVVLNVRLPERGYMHKNDIAHEIRVHLDSKKLKNENEEPV